MAFDSQEEFQFLLPGIADDVTLDKITPKLSWRDLFMLSSVSRVWRHANRSRQVYAARLRHDSLETLVLMDYAHLKGRAKSSSSPQRKAVKITGKSSKKETSRGGRRADSGGPSISGIALCSMRDGSCSELPPIPKVVGGFPKLCQFVSLDGKVYVFGGIWSPRERCKQVYVLDLVGQGQWRQCANMLQQREIYECLARNGKIYVFGSKFTLGAEVYDPQKDTWSRIEGNALLLRFPQRAHIFRGELVLYDESSFIRSFSEDNDTLDQIWSMIAISLRMERSIRGSILQTQFFMAQGKLHRMRNSVWLPMDRFDIEVHSADENTWTNLHSFDFSATRERAFISVKFVKPMAVLAVNDELLAVFSWSDGNLGAGFCLLQSKGFGSTTDKFYWQRAFELNYLDTQDSCFERNICTCAFQL